MMNTEKVSVIMPVRNSVSYAEQAIQSVMEQTYENWELLVIDDASTDDTPEILKQQYTDKRIRFFTTGASPLGPAGARNIGLRNAEGDYIAFLDSDDMWLPEKLEKQLSFMNSLKIKGIRCVWSCTGYSIMNEYGVLSGMKVYPFSKAGYRKIFLTGNPVGNSTVLYDRHSLGELVIPDIRSRNDFALWLQIARKGELCYGMQEILVKYRLHQNSVSAKKLSLIKNQWKLYHEIENHSVAVSAFAMLCLFIIKPVVKTSRRLAGFFRTQ